MPRKYDRSEDAYLEATNKFDLMTFFDHMDYNKDGEGAETAKAYLRGVLSGISYKQIAEDLDTTENAITTCLNEHFAKRIRKLFNIDNISWIRLPQLLVKERYENTFIPGGTKAGNQNFGCEDAETFRYYRERPDIETKCRDEMLKPGGLIRIEAPWQMGKTSLINWLLQQGKNEGYLTVYLNFRSQDRAMFNNLDKCLRGFCALVGKKLNGLGLPIKMPQKLDDYWDDTFGSKSSCKHFFEEILLPKISKPLLLCIDDVAHVYQKPEIADEFFDVIRDWNEEVNRIRGDKDRSYLWKNLRFVLTSSRRIQISDSNISPFNIGLTVRLPEFELSQILDLAKRYQLDWQEEQVRDLMALMGGHPYLVKEALDFISRNDRTLDQVLETAATENGIYQNHLEDLLRYLRGKESLEVAMKQVADATEPVWLNQDIADILHTMGLVELKGNAATPRCQLYRQYFQERLRVGT